MKHMRKLLALLLALPPLLPPSLPLAVLRRRRSDLRIVQTVVVVEIEDV